MIRHIVLFKLNHEDSKLNKKEVLNILKANLENLKNKIPEIKFYEVGINIVDSPNSFDIALNSEFKSFEDIERYRIHPEHLKIVEIINTYCDKRVAVDYEI